MGGGVAKGDGGTRSEFIVVLCGVLSCGDDRLVGDDD